MDLIDRWRWAPYFTPQELACPCCNLLLVDETFLDRLVKYRQALDRPMIINSGARCSAHNAATGGAENSAHLMLRAPEPVRRPAGDDPRPARAVDFQTGDLVDLRQKMISLALAFGFRGLGMRWHGIPRRQFMHLDDRPGAVRIWTRA